jgi:hypothetical protein
MIGRPPLTLLCSKDQTMNKILPAGLMALLASAAFLHGSLEASSKTGASGSKAGSTKSVVVSNGYKTTTTVTTSKTIMQTGSKTPVLQVKNGSNPYSGKWGGWYGNGWGFGGGHGGWWGYRPYYPCCGCAFGGCCQVAADGMDPVQPPVPAELVTGAAVLGGEVGMDPVQPPLPAEDGPPETNGQPTPGDPLSSGVKGESN